MGKKLKTGKTRKDKFYKLAKETGYRSRAAFKLIQLNRKFEFLQKCTVLVDLCAAPGGWLQVASKFMPVSSQIVGVDIVPIKPIRNVITLQNDITTEKCRQELKKQLHTAKADIFLNDGAPNVGMNWVQDAYSQSCLTLSALKLATGFLRKGGWFISKCFRSQDYHALLWVFQQLFKKVHATKPQASRHESAEIFVVCQGYKAPDKLDSKFLDPKHVFSEVEGTKKTLTLKQLVQPGKKSGKVAAQGYPEGDYTLFHKRPVSEFLQTSSHIELLSNTTELVFDDDTIANHPLTTEEVRECCKDLKVLGKQELRALLSWRKKIRAQLHSEESKTKELEEKEADEEEDEDVKIQRQIAELQESENKELKKKKRKVREEKKKLQHKMDMKMILPKDVSEMTVDLDLFNLKNIKTKKHLSEVSEGDVMLADEDEPEETPPRKLVEKYSRYSDSEAEDEDDEMSHSEDQGSDLEDGDLEENYENCDDNEEQNPLVRDLSNETAAERQRKKANLWFSKSVFDDGLDDDQDLNTELQQAADEYQRQGGTVVDGKKTKVTVISKHERKKKSKVDNKSDPNADDNLDEITETHSSGIRTSNVDDSGSELSSGDSDYDVNDAVKPNISDKQMKRKSRGKEVKRKAQNAKDGFEVIPASEPAAKVQELDAEGLALGAMMINSKKIRREIIESAYNRYTSNDDGLPDWFVEDEAKHSRKQTPVSKDLVNEYKERLKEINARPIKKVAEAKARKKRKAAKRLERARKKAEAITENLDMTDREKMAHIKQLYKKAGIGKKRRELTYVIAKKGMGKRVKKPKGVSGPFKVVDRRMKKDRLKAKASEKTARTKAKPKSKSR